MRISEKRQQEEMRQVEDHIKEFYENNEEGVFMVYELGVLKELEGKKELFLL